MGPKVKKAPKNAFTFFLEDYVKSVRQEGRQISYKIAAEECGPLWKDLSEEEKEKYTKLAAAYKTLSKDDKANKFTSSGISYLQLEREQQELKLKEDLADTEIKMTISSLDFESIKTHFFYIIHCNHYCKTDAGLYVPGELAISEFNLEDGVRRTYHTLIDPGSIPLGYAFEAKQMIEKVHDLPYPPYEEGESDYFGIFLRILDFLEPGRFPDGRYPPLYCIESNISASENVLKALTESSGEEGSGFRYFRVYRLDKMFFWLKNKCVEYVEEENVGFPVMSNAENEISKDVFCFTPGISCPFHTNSEGKYHSCSLSVVQRFAYVICDHCCQYVGVEIIPGKHSRLLCDADRKGTSSRIQQSSKRSRSSPPSSEVDWEGQSSFADEASSFDWRRDGGGSFLHDEIEASFSAFEVSSVASRSTFRAPTSYVGSSVQGRGVRRGEEEEELYDDIEEDFKRVMSLGRGASFR